MILIPLATFYFFFLVLFRGDRSMLGWSGIAAVVAVNGVIASYVVMAWNEKDEDLHPDAATSRRINNIEKHKNRTD
jgi:hypothetical protein